MNACFSTRKFPAFSFFQDSSSFLSFVQMKSAPCRNIAIWWSGFGGEKKSDETTTGTVRKFRDSPLDQSSLSQRVAQLENSARRHSRNSARQRKKNPIKKEGKNAKKRYTGFRAFPAFFFFIASDATISGLQHSLHLPPRACKRDYFSEQKNTRRKLESYFYEAEVKAGKAWSGAIWSQIGKVIDAVILRMIWRF